MEEPDHRAAVTLFAEQGFDAHHRAAGGDHAEVTKGALYHYFDSKDDLLYEIYHSLIGTAERRRWTGSSRAGLGAAETVRAILVNVVRTTARRLPEAEVFFREAHKLDSERMAAFRADRRRYHESFRQVIANGQAAGEFAGHVPADTVVQIAHGRGQPIAGLVSAGRAEDPRATGQRDRRLRAGGPAALIATATATT